MSDIAETIHLMIKRISSGESSRIGLPKKGVGIEEVPAFIPLYSSDALDQLEDCFDDQFRILLDDIVVIPFCYV